MLFSSRDFDQIPPGRIDFSGMVEGIPLIHPLAGSGVARAKA
jgi:hypothetical protein